MTTMPLADLLRDWRSGEDDSLDEEIARLQADPQHAIRVDLLVRSIKRGGMREPIVLGSDGRVWDGHHRIAAAVRLDLASVPVREP